MTRRCNCRSSVTHETLDVARVQGLREEMERAEARRLQPHFIASFFREALPDARSQDKACGARRTGAGG